MRGNVSGALSRGRWGVAGPFAALALLAAPLTACTTNTCEGDRGGSTVCVNNGSAPDADIKYKQQVVTACGQLRASSRWVPPADRESGRLAYNKRKVLEALRTSHAEYRGALDTLWRQETPGPFKARQATAKAAGDAWLADVERLFKRAEVELPDPIPIDGYYVVSDPKETASRQAFLQAMTALGEKECSLEEVTAS
ncbi:hypothetical protein [Streptomyces purpureus]|uniref:hypothetical protein n=1 Tax=Streptomyces purpureus TaxID=1951 RepID=UPI001319E5F6|nr:hypothetical protein [Streptomyces purpureus]